MTFTRMTVLRSSSDCWVLVVAPRKSAALEMVSGLREVAKLTGMPVSLADSGNALTRVKGKTIRVVTSSHLLAALAQRNPTIPLAGLNLVVCEGLEQLDSKYELAMSLLRHATQTHPTRFVGFSYSL